MSMIRTRWAAVGAAVAVSLGAGGIGLVDATKGSGERAVYTAIEPCRLVDTRPVDTVGGRTVPLGANDIMTVHVQGDEGECIGIPADAVAAGLNITAVGATELTHLTVWAEGPVPNSASLNPAPGQPPTPNAVTTDLAGDGSFLVRNEVGSVHVIIDLVGYYQHHDHDDRYYTEDEADALATRIGFDTARIDAFVEGDTVTDLVTLDLANDTGRRTVTIVTATLHSWSAGYQISWWTLEVATNGAPRATVLDRRSTVADPGVLLMPSDTITLTTRIVQEPGDVDVVSLSGVREAGAVGAVLEAEMVSITAPFDETGSVPTG